MSVDEFRPGSLWDLTSGGSVSRRSRMATPRRGGRGRSSARGLLAWSAVEVAEVPTGTEEESEL